MTFHTILPLDVVLEGFGDTKRMRPVMEVRIGGVLMQIEPVQPGIGRIVRLLDCPLDAYLKPEYAPGSIIWYGPDP